MFFERYQFNVRFGRSKGGQVKDSELIQTLSSIDTTGSMTPCIGQVRRRVKETMQRLFRDVLNLQVGIIAHGDYCDAGSAYVTRHFPFSTNERRLCDFIENTRNTGGGDAPECYELVLHEARSFAWSPNARSRALVMIGDDVPHGPNYKGNRKRLDWRAEASALPPAIL